MAVPPLVLLPPQRAAMVDGNGNATNEWYIALRRILENLEQSGVDPAVIVEIQSRLDELEETKLDNFQIVGLLSVEVQGTPANGAVVLQLLNDVASPGNTYYYGTGPTGTKGWQTIRSALDFGDGIDLTTGSDGVTEISFNADTAEIAHLPGATYSTVQKMIDVMFSPGIITGGEVTELTTTSVRITAGTAVVRIADDNVSELRFFDFAQQDFSVPDVQVTHFYALDYNGGSPVIVESTVTENWDRDTEIPLGSALRGDGILNITPNPYRVGDVITNLIQRLDAIGPVQRDNSIGGLQIGETGTRNVTVSAGRLWSRVSDFNIPSKNSSVDSMQSVYFNGVNLTVTSGITQWDNLNFNNLGTGSLQLMGNNKYANLWFFMSFNGDHYGFAYGTNEYNSLGDAANEGVPSYLTQNFFNQFILLGRFVFQKSAATASQIESAFDRLFTTQAVNTHNDLGGLQGGTAGEYYHLTATEYANLASPGYIDGLRMTWNSGTSLSVSSGTAYVQSAATKLASASTITKSSLSLSASTIYHVYLFNNAGSADVEIVTTAPASPYNGSARSKTGDTSRRYLGSVVTDSGGALHNFLHVPESGAIYFQTGAGNAPFMLLTAGSSTVTTNISLSAFMPTTGVAAMLQMFNNDTGTGVLRVGNPNMGTLSSSNWMARAAANTIQMDQCITLPTDSSQQISYLMTGTPAGGGVGASIRCNGYHYLR